MLHQFAPPTDSPLRALRAISGWEDVPTSDLVPLAAGAIRRQFASGERLGRAREIQVVVSGTIRHRSEIVGPGGAVGLMEALARTDAAPAHAVGPVETLGIATQHLDDVLEESFTLWRLTAGHYARRLLQNGVIPAPVAPPFPQDRPLRLSERITLLRGVPIPLVTGIEALAELALAADEITAEPGQRLWSAGEKPERVLVLAAGSIRRDDGRLLTPAARPGILESLAGTRFATGGVAEAPVRALSLEIDVLEDVLEDHPDAARDVLCALVRASF